MTDEKRLFIAIHSNKKEEPETTFVYIYNKYKPLLVFIASQYVKDIYDIDDVVQETFIKFFNNVENIQTTIKSYLSVSCKNTALDLLKKNKFFSYVDEEKLYSYVDDNELVLDNLISNERYNAILKDMKTILTQEDINIILLHLINNLTFDEIALKLNQNVNAIKAKYYRAIKKYKKKRGVK